MGETGKKEGNRVWRIEQVLPSTAHLFQIKSLLLQYLISYLQCYELKIILFKRNCIKGFTYLEWMLTVKYTLSSASSSVIISPLYEVKTDYLKIMCLVCNPVYFWHCSHRIAWSVCMLTSTQSLLMIMYVMFCVRFTFNMLVDDLYERVEIISIIWECQFFEVIMLLHLFIKHLILK